MVALQSDFGVEVGDLDEGFGTDMIFSVLRVTETVKSEEQIII